MKRYRTIVVDPPWGYEGMSAPWRSSTPQTYPLMKTAEIKGLPVGELASPTCHLYLWAVLPMMAEAYEVIKAWGFHPSTVLTWCKPGVGLGLGWRGNTEHLIVARRGEPRNINPTCGLCGGRARGANKCACETPDWRHRGAPFGLPQRRFANTAPGTWYQAPRGAHSEKPDLFLDLIEQMSPAPRLEMFARRRRLGWDVWGNEVESDIDLAA